MGVGVGTVVAITGREGKKKHITGNLSFMSENERGLKADRGDFEGGSSQSERGKPLERP